MTSPSDPGSPSSGQADSDLRAARIGSRGGIIGATIALVAVILGAVVAGVYTSLSTDRQIDASQSQARDEFIREERQEAYSEFIAAEQALYDVESRYATEAWEALSETPNDPDSEPYEVWGPRWRASLEVRESSHAIRSDLIKALAGVRTVGSERAIASAEEVSEINSPLIEFMVTDEAEISGLAIFRDTLVSFAEAGESRAAALAAFQAAARTDLGG